MADGALGRGLCIAGDAGTSEGGPEEGRRMNACDGIVPKSMPRMEVTCARTLCG